MATAGGVASSLNSEIERRVQTSLPHLTEHHAPVAKIEAEQALVAANCELVDRVEREIQAALARISGGHRPGELT